jgi:hypothetical protein
VGGRPTDSAFPYFNLATPGGGMILAVGWPGQWAAAFARDADNGLRITAGQQLTHLCLRPGEEVRTPLVALMFWKGTDVARSQNLWRRWMLACNMPRPDGKPLRSIYSSCCCAYFPDYKASEAIEKLLNLGNPAARQWLTDHIDRTLTEQGIDLYRQDHNIAPLDLWRKNDAADRQGVTENFCVQGYLAFWDALRQRHPGMLIDSCASGGRRNDLETLRRAVPLLQSDLGRCTRRRR